MATRKTAKQSATTRPAPSTKPLVQRLVLKPGTVLFAPNVPAEVLPLLSPLPEGAQLVSTAPRKVDAALLFARDQAELKRVFARLEGKLSEDPLLWLCYPKGGSGVDTDLNRDRGWEPVDAAGLRGVAQIAVNEVWSALRFRFGPPRR